MGSRALPSTSPFHLSLQSRAPTSLPPFSRVRLLSGDIRAFGSSSESAQSSKEARFFPASLPIHSKNPHSICRDIQKLARRGELKEALTILDYFEQRGIPVNATTFSRLLSACARFKALKEGRQVHVHLRINGFERNEFLLTKLVQMYASCGSPEDARRVFSELSPGNVFTWNALLRGNVVGGRRWGYGTLSAFSEMREAGVDPNVYSFSCLIKSLAGSPSPIQGMKAHALMIKNGVLESSVLLRTSLIDMYFKCRKIRMAVKLFDESPQRDIVLWGAVIAGFAHNRLHREALDFLRWMASKGTSPNSVILATVLPVAGELGNRKLGRELHCYAIKYFREFQNWPFIHSAVIDMYCKCGDLISGRLVFYGCDQRTTVSWTALMGGYVSNARFDQALRAIVWMQQEGLRPDVVSVATVLPVCAKLGALNKGKEIHGYALRNGFFPNISISTSLMTMYSSCGSLQYSRGVFSCLERKNVVAWTAMVDSFAKNDRLVEALAVFRSMLLTGQHRPDYVSVGRILRICGQMGALKLGKEIHAQVLRRKLDGIPLVAAEVIGLYGRCGMVDISRAVFDRVDSPGSLTWTGIIESYGVNGRKEEALELFKEMVASGFVPNRFTFDVVLSVCENAGLVNEALEVFNMLTRRFKVNASEDQFDRLVSLLDKAGRAEETRRFLSLRSAAAGIPSQSLVFQKSNGSRNQRFVLKKNR